MSDLIWTGTLNDRYAIRGEVGLYDTTLRDGEQTVGVVLSPEEKLEIARLLDGLGIRRIEAGFPRVSEDDRRAVELIAGAGLNAEVWGFSRAVPADLELLVELGVEASVIESPISDLKLDAIGTPVPVSHPICHGVGARAHEPPYAHQLGGGEIAEGMVLAIEPGIYWPQGGGLRVEDNFLITADGAEKISGFPDGIVRV